MISEHGFSGAFRDMFGKFDTNQNGTLDLAEVLQGTSKFGVDIDTKYLEQCFHNLDKNGDDKLDFDEFRCMYKSLFTDNLSEGECLCISFCVFFLSAHPLSPSPVSLSPHVTLTTLPQM